MKFLIATLFLVFSINTYAEVIQLGVNAYVQNGIVHSNQCMFFGMGKVQEPFTDKLINIELKDANESYIGTWQADSEVNGQVVT